MLDDDLSSAEDAAAMFHDPALPPVSQLWDGAKRLGREVARSLGAPKWTAWDIYLFYPPGAEWTDAGLPPPEAALAQVADVVVGTKGTLPAAGDPARVPAEVRERVDVVGEQKDLDALLLRVADGFASRHH